MHAVVRNYSGSGAKELYDLLEQRKQDVEDLMRSVPGFVAYLLMHTDDGGIAVTVCEDKKGTDESVRLARDWVKENVAEGTSPPSISEGTVVLFAG